MTEIAFSSSFKKAFKKKIKGRKDIENSFWKTAEIFVKNPFHPHLKTHKLSGRLKSFWAYSVENNLRVLFCFEENYKKAVFVDIGSHDEVY